MKNILKALRYLVFGIFIICNAIIASVAVWNHSLTDSMNWDLPVDLYLLFLGCFGLALIFTIIFVELAYQDPVTGRVWFECTWIGLVCLMYLAGAAAASATFPNLACGTQVPTSLHNICISAQVIMAFAWISTIILMSYFSFLVIASMIHFKHDSRIWYRYVHKFPWSGARPSDSLPTASPSPSLPQFLVKKMPSIVAPRPQRVAPRELYNYRSGLSSDYEIEHYRPPSIAVASHLVPPPSAAAQPFMHPQTAPQPTDSYAITSFYPQYMQSAFTSSSSTPAPTHQHVQQPRDTPPSPPPLGDWPRPNAILEPLRAKRGRPLPPPTTAEGSPKPRPLGPRPSQRASTSNKNPQPPNPGIAEVVDS